MTAALFLGSAAALKAGNEGASALQRLSEAGPHGQ
jgi:hypothetical protein